MGGVSRCTPVLEIQQINAILLTTLVSLFKVLVPAYTSVRSSTDQVGVVTQAARQTHTIQQASRDSLPSGHVWVPITNTHVHENPVARPLL